MEIDEKTMEETLKVKPTWTLIKGLKSHPRNYRIHPEDQINHIMMSIKEHGFYRNVVLAKDGTILAGHGVVEASKRLGMKSVLSIRLNINPGDAKALKILTGDNMLSHLAEDNDRLLTEMLKEIHESDSLIGTGFDEQMVAALAMVTRNSDEIASFDEAAEWIGMPDYETSQCRYAIKINFITEGDRQKYIEKTELKMTTSKPGLSTWLARWPYTEENDFISIRFEE